MRCGAKVVAVSAAGGAGRGGVVVASLVACWVGRGKVVAVLAAIDVGRGAGCGGVGSRLGGAEAR